MVWIDVAKYWGLPTLPDLLPHLTRLSNVTRIALGLHLMARISWLALIACFSNLPYSLFLAKLSVCIKL